MKKSQKGNISFYYTYPMRFHLIGNAEILSFLGKSYMNLCDSTPDANSAAFQSYQAINYRYKMSWFSF